MEVQKTNVMVYESERLIIRRPIVADIDALLDYKQEFMDNI